MSLAQSDAMSRIQSVIAADKPPDSLMSPKAAYEALLGEKASLEYMTSGATCVAPYCRDKVSWPDAAGGSSLEKCLSSADSFLVAEGSSELFKDHDCSFDVPSANVYWDFS